MNDDRQRHHRRSIRLKGYDYAQAGAYFITVVTYDRECLFGDVVENEMRLSDYGSIVQDEWTKSAVLRPRVMLDAFVVMPNHVHGIITLADDDGRGTLQRRGTWQRRGTLQRAPTFERFGKPTSDSIPTILRLFKSATTKRINEMRETPGMPVWQRNYYEHIVRNESSLDRIRQYIFDNPARWAIDRENPQAIAREPEEAWRP